MDQEDPAKAAEAPAAGEGEVQEGEKAEADLCSLNSSEISAVETIAFDAQSLRESEYHVFGLVCEAKYSAAMTYYRQRHKSRWMEEGATGGGGGGRHVIVTDEDDVRGVVSIYCRISAESGESEQQTRKSVLLIRTTNAFVSDLFALTTVEVPIQEHCSRLMDCSLQLLSTVRAMEAQLASQKQSRREEATRTPTASASAAGGAAAPAAARVPVVVAPPAVAVPPPPDGAAAAAAVAAVLEGEPESVL